ncbi:hypothetical protein L3V31_21405 [Vibrio sp. J1-1]|uniref:hypothetical protein n=1 Tax=Vibrio sp. J1-1 TaxID=2912251 RepID=UPI001F37367A|nr:hypothetical protein [Vibrio sp. J1-1]MCF7484247.1 hypothetical protein [Vibrio sp. J1-1]
MSKFIGTISFAIICTFFFLVSVAGESGRADTIIKELFSKLKNEDFSSECIEIVRIDGQSVGSNCEQDMFVFTISLLKRFELFGASNYFVYLERENYWIPFINNHGIRVSLSLSEAEQSSFSILSNDLDYVTDLFFVKRTGFRWDIDKIVISDPKLVEIFNETRKQIDFNKYVVQLDSGYRLKEIAIQNGEFTDIDRLLLKFSMEKLLNDLNLQKPNKAFKSDS